MAAMSSTIPTLFGDHADGSKTAIYFFERHLRYEQVNAAQSAFAAELAKRGVGPGARIAVLTQNDPSFVIATLAAWSLGAAVVPLNPMLTPAELRYVLQDSGATAVIALPSLLPRLAASGVAPQHLYQADDLERVGLDGTIALEADCTPTADVPRMSEVCRGPASFDALDFPDTTPAAIVYTSGTTGRPKGAVLSHANIVSSVRLWNRWFALSDRDVMVALAPLCHITGLVGHVAISLLNGGGLALFHRFDPNRAWRVIEQTRGTVVVASITAYVAMARAEECGRRDVSSLRLTITGGAPVAPAIHAEVFERTGLSLLNSYGLTEAASLCAAVRAGETAPIDVGSGALSVGRIAGDTDVRFVSDDGPVAEGESGELAIRGEQLGLGYWTPGGQIRRFADAQGWFRTGDVAKRDRDGWIYIVDRLKDMIIASGFKVWPREVEDALLEHPGVVDACVVGVPDAYRGETVWAYVVPERRGDLTESELEAFARERLSAYKRPRRVCLVETLPRNANGKLLRRNVRDLALSELGQKYMIDHNR